MPSNCGAGEDSWESLGQQGDQTSQSWRKSVEGLMMKLKLQYFGHLMRRANSGKEPDAGKKLNAGGEGDNRGWDCWMASPTQWSLSKLWEIEKDREVWCTAVHEVTQSQTWLSDWITMRKQPEKCTRQNFQQCFSVSMTGRMRSCTSLADGENCVPFILILVE